LRSKREQPGLQGELRSKREQPGLQGELRNKREQPGLSGNPDCVVSNDMDPRIREDEEWWQR